MRENDEITGLFRSRLAGAEMTVREGFWEKLQEDVASPAAKPEEGGISFSEILSDSGCRICYICVGRRFGSFLVFLSERRNKGCFHTSSGFDTGRQFER